MKIAGFTQLHNELEKGNLENWFKCMNEVCDVIYIYDQNSTDGSVEFYEEQEKAKVIFSSKNRFDEEILCKQDLLNAIRDNDPDVDWIFWMDGDTILDGRLCDYEKMREFIGQFHPIDLINGISLGHKNLWRSDTYERIDAEFDLFDRQGIICLWRLNDNLQYSLEKGLHKPQFPTIGIGTVVPVLDYKLIHRGFATDESILKKYEVYLERGMKPMILNRIIDEFGEITVERLPDEIFPSWYKKDNDINPKEITKLREVHKERINKAVEKYVKI